MSISKLEELRKELLELVNKTPELQSFIEYIEKAESPKTLDRKTKELMSLAIGIAIRCEPCILWHAAEAIKAGASMDEILDTIKVAVCMGGGPALAYSVKAYELVKELYTSLKQQ
ncbi:MAG: carboxymuconolactone decarboxylase family protein [Desulfurococcaceae archaeon]